MDEKRVVLCGANAYDMKYYFNPAFNGIPDSIKDELHIICVLYIGSRRWLRSASHPAQRLQ